MILSIVSEWKIKFFYETNLKIRKNTFNNVFFNRICLYYRFLSIFKKWLDFYKSWFSSEKIISITLLFPILIVKFSVAGIVKRIFSKTTIFKDFLLIFKIGNSRVVENIFPAEINHTIWKFNHLKIFIFFILAIILMFSCSQWFKILNLPAFLQHRAIGLYDL